MSFPIVTLDGKEITLTPENLASIGQQAKAQIGNLSLVEAVRMGQALLGLKSMLSL